MWDQYKLEMSFITELCGGIPRNEEVIEGWVASKGSGDAAKAIESRDPIDPELEMAKVWVGFNRDEKGLYLRAATVRAHLKDCATQLGAAINKGAQFGAKPIKQLKHKICQALYVLEDRVYILDKSGIVVQKPSGYRDATLSVMTAQGPRTCLKRVDYVFPAKMVCTLQVLAGGEVTLDHVKDLLDYGCVHGYGQDRSLQYGRYTWTLADMD